MASVLAPGLIDPAAEPLRRSNPHRFRDARPGHLAVVAGAGRPWYIGRVCEVTPRPHGRVPAFVRVMNVDNGDIERIPAPWIVELLVDGAPAAGSASADVCSARSRHPCTWDPVQGAGATVAAR